MSWLLILIILVILISVPFSSDSKEDVNAIKNKVSELDEVNSKLQKENSSLKKDIEEKQVHINKLSFGILVLAVIIFIYLTNSADNVVSNALTKIQNEFSKLVK